MSTWYAVNSRTKEHVRLSAAHAYDREKHGLGWYLRKADEDGWIPHEGGGCPLPKGHLVDVRLLPGPEHLEVISLAANDVAGQASWLNIDPHRIITHYRPVFEDERSSSHPEWKPGDRCGR